MLTNKLPKGHVVLLMVFFGMWLYTEIAEYMERDTFQQQVHNFMYKGERFTADQGRAMNKRIAELEAKVLECEKTKCRSEPHVAE